MRKYLTLIAIGVVVAAALGIFAATTHAQRYPWSNDRDRYDNRSDDDTAQRAVPGRFDYYALVLSWSPTYCSSNEGEDDDQQCNRRDGRRFAFVLHGLWPQYERGYPSSCRMSRRPFVPQSTIDGMLDIMPSKRLVIHEYQKHGTCSGLDPQNYYGLARRLFTSIEIPDRFENPFESQLMDPGELRRAFLRANPQLDQSMIAVACQGGGRLREVRICFGKDGKPRGCGDNENQRRLCSTDRLFVPPSRSTARYETPSRSSSGSTGSSGTATGRPDPSLNSPLPGPRMDIYRRRQQQ